MSYQVALMGTTIQIKDDAGGQSEGVSQSSSTVMLILPPGLNRPCGLSLGSGVLSGTPGKWGYEANEEKSQ